MKCNKCKYFKIDAIIPFKKKVMFCKKIDIVFKNVAQANKYSKTCDKFGRFDRLLRMWGRERKGMIEP